MVRVKCHLKSDFGKVPSGAEWNEPLIYVSHLHSTLTPFIFSFAIISDNFVKKEKTTKLLSISRLGACKVIILFISLSARVIE